MANNKTGAFINCLNCNKDFWVVKSKIYRRKYCSLKCRREYKKDIKLKCLKCNCEFIRNQSKVKYSRYCSRECSLIEWRKKAKPHKHTQETKDKISKTVKKLGLKPPYRKGFKISDKQKKLLSELRKGENSPFWRGGVTAKNSLIRASYQYRAWRREVFERDDFTCKLCNIRGGILNADHIKPFALYEDLRFDLSNGRTLCVDCHRKTKTYGRNTQNKGKYANT